MDTNHIDDVERIRALREKNLITEEEMADLLGRASRSEPMDSEALEPVEAQKKAPAKPSLRTRYLVAGLAVLFLGAMFFMAKGLSISSEEAFQKGLDFEMGQDSKEATRWYLKAAQKGHPEAQYRLAVIYKMEGNRDKYFEWLQKSAKNGHPDAVFQLGEFFHKGSSSVSPDLDEAEKWYRKAVELNVYRAQEAVDALEEEKRIALFPKTVQEIPNYFLNIVKNLNDDDYPSEKGYANYDKAFRKFIEDGEWSVLDGYVGWSSEYRNRGIRYSNRLNSVDFNEYDTQKLQRINEDFRRWQLGDERCYYNGSEIYNVKTGAGYLVFFDGVGPNLYDESKKAKYKIIFICHMRDSVDDWEIYWNVLMNGQEISAGDFLARIYLGSK